VKQGLLLFAHGARDRAWAAPFEDVAARLRAGAPAVPVELAFLELMAPTLAEAGDRLVAAGCRAVDVVPLFLGAGGHVRRDVPDLVARLVAAHPTVVWRLRPPIGEAEEVVAAMAAAARRLAAEPDPAPPRD
jgi:sirohydrochlorin cobaltochelatase